MNIVELSYMQCRVGHGFACLCHDSCHSKIKRENALNPGISGAYTDIDDCHGKEGFGGSTSVEISDTMP